MKTLFDAMTNYLEAKDLHYSRTEDYTALTVCYSLENVSVTCTIRIDEEKRYLSCCTRAGIIVPMNKFHDVAEFIARANYGMGIGSLLLNYESGDVFFKTAVFADDTELSPDMIRPVLYQNMNTYDLLYPGLMRVLYQDCDPEEAVREDKSMSKPEATQEETEAVFAKVMAEIYGGEPIWDFDARPSAGRTKSRRHLAADERLGEGIRSTAGR